MPVVPNRAMIQEGKMLLETEMPELLAMLGDPHISMHAQPLAAIQVKNREALVDAMTHLADVIGKASKAARFLSWVGLGLTAVIAIATVVLALQASQ